MNNYWEKKYKMILYMPLSYFMFLSFHDFLEKKFIKLICFPKLQNLNQEPRSRKVLGPNDTEKNFLKNFIE